MTPSPENPFAYCERFMARYFQTAHLPPALRIVAEPYAIAARRIIGAVKYEPVPEIGLVIGAVERTIGSVIMPEDEIEARRAWDRVQQAALWDTAVVSRVRRLREGRSHDGGSSAALSVLSVLRLLLEAKDCAVRSVLPEPRLPAPRTVGPFGSGVK
jgi:hypothetical protein